MYWLDYPRSDDGKTVGWRVTSAGGRICAESPRLYTRKGDAVRAFEAIGRAWMHFEIHDRKEDEAVKAKDKPKKSPKSKKR